MSKASKIDVQNLAHTGEKSHTCPVCFKVYTQSGTRNRHLKTQHPESSAQVPKIKPKVKVPKIAVKSNPNMVRTGPRGSRSRYTLANYPECVFEPDYDQFKIKRDDYLQSGDVKYNKFELFELRRKASNVGAAASSRKKKKDYESGLRLEVSLLKQKNELVQEEQDLILDQIQLFEDGIDDANAEIKNQFENNPSKALDQFLAIESLAIELEWPETFNGFDGSTTEVIFENM